MDDECCVHGVFRIPAIGELRLKKWSGKAIRRRALALNLSTYKLKKTINYNLSQLKKAYSDEVRLENYRQSLRLEGFDTTADSFNPNLLTKVSVPFSGDRCASYSIFSSLSCRIASIHS